MSDKAHMGNANPELIQALNDFQYAHEDLLKEIGKIKDSILTAEDRAKRLMELFEAIGVMTGPNDPERE